MKKTMILLAGGVGSRMNSIIPKQFIEVDNQPLIIYVLKQIDKIECIDEIFIPCLKDYINKLQELIIQHNIKKKIYIVSGGYTGVLSTYNALIELKKKYNNCMVIIHDANRPFINNDILKKIVNTCRNKGNCISIYKQRDCLVSSNNGMLCDKYLGRKNIYNYVKPECYYLKSLLSVYTKFSTEALKKFDSTAELYFLTNKKIFVEEIDNNIKITYPEDIRIFEYFKEGYYEKN